MSILINDPRRSFYFPPRINNAFTTCEFLRDGNVGLLILPIGISSNKKQRVIFDTICSHCIFEDFVWIILPFNLN